MDIDRHLANPALSQEGRDWLKKALHPAAPTTACVGVPDGSSRLSAVPEFVREATITCPTAFNSGQWDLLVVGSNSDVFGAVCFARPSGGLWQFYNPGDLFRTASVAQQPGIVGYIPYKTGVTTGTGYVGQGTPFSTTGGSVSGGPNQINYYVTNITSADNPLAWRAAASGITAYMTASDLYNSGTVYAGNFPARVAVDESTAHYLVNTDPAGPTSLLFPIGASLAGNVYPVAKYAYFRIPAESAAMQAENPGIFVGPAKGGAYVPSHHRSFEWARPAAATTLAMGEYAVPQYSWVGTRSDGTFPPISAMFQSPLYMVNPDASIGGPRMVDSIYQLTDVTTGSPTYLSSLTFSTFMTAQYLQSPRFDINAGPGLLAGLATGVDDRMTTIILFTGLDPKSAVTVKTMITQEMVPQPTSACQEYVKKCPDADDLAIRLYFEARSRMAQAYPSSYNVLGALGPIVGAALRKLLPMAVSAGKQLLPQVLPEVSKWILGPSAPSRREVATTGSEPTGVLVERPKRTASVSSRVSRSSARGSAKKVVSKKRKARIRAR